MLASSRHVSVKVLHMDHLWTRKFQSLHFSVECVNLVQEFPCSLSSLLLIFCLLSGEQAAASGGEGTVSGVSQRGDSDCG